MSTVFLHLGEPAVYEKSWIPFLEKTECSSTLPTQRPPPTMVRPWWGPSTLPTLASSTSSACPSLRCATSWKSYFWPGSSWHRLNGSPSWNPGLLWYELKAGRTIIAGHVVLVPLQIVGGRHMDRVTLALAREAERLFGGWIPPSWSLSIVQKDHVKII